LKKTTSYNKIVSFITENENSQAWDLWLWEELCKLILNMPHSEYKKLTIEIQKWNKDNLWLLINALVNIDQFQELLETNKIKLFGIIASLYPSDEVYDICQLIEFYSETGLLERKIIVLESDGEKLTFPYQSELFYEKNGKDFQAKLLLKYKSNK
jgi:hypothetical protein